MLETNWVSAPPIRCGPFIDVWSQVAPPTGLTLWQISFSGSRWDA